MPLQFSSMSGSGAGFCHKPQDFMKSIRKHGQDAFIDKIRCLPMRNRNKQHVGREEAIRKLTHDVELLNEQLPYCNKETGCIENNNPNDESLRLSLSLDVQTQIQKVVALIKELAGESVPACQRNTPAQEQEKTELLEEMLAADIPVQLLAEIPLLEFEARKDVMNMCCALLWSEMPEHIEDHVLEYLRHHKQVFSLLADGYASEETALHYGVVLRSCARHSRLVEAFLASGKLFDLIQYAQFPSIDIASDAFYTLREFLLEHKDVSAAWLSEHSAQFFAKYNCLLKSEDYLIERQALTLLGVMLTDRTFKKVILAYVSNDKNLQIHMNLLKDSSMAVQVEAFHVFKVFVANPNKSARVHMILYKNREKLINHLETLHSLKLDDKRFPDEQKKIIDKLRDLSPPP